MAQCLSVTTMLMGKIMRGLAGYGTAQHLRPILMEWLFHFSQWVGTEWLVIVLQVTCTQIIVGKFTLNLKLSLPYQRIIFRFIVSMDDLSHHISSLLDYKYFWQLPSTVQLHMDTNGIQVASTLSMEPNYLPFNLRRSKECSWFRSNRPILAFIREERQRFYDICTFIPRKRFIIATETCKNFKRILKNNLHRVSWIRNNINRNENFLVSEALLISNYRVRASFDASSMSSRHNR